MKKIVWDAKKLEGSILVLLLEIEKAAESSLLHSPFPNLQKPRWGFQTGEETDSRKKEWKSYKPGVFKPWTLSLLSLNSFCSRKHFSSSNEKIRLKWKLRHVVWDLLQALSITRLKMCFLNPPSSPWPKKKQELMADIFVQKWRLKDPYSIRLGGMWRWELSTLLPSVLKMASQNFTDTTNTNK